jgi:glycosyltransferase involved in cell wall biosynthesis
LKEGDLLNSQPKINFVCPTRNRPDFIETSLKFFSEQDCPGVRLLIVDNSSPSNFATEEIVRNFKNPSVDFIRATGNLSMVDNWEFALDNAVGEYIGFVTDKMFLKPKFLKSVIHFLDFETPEILSWQDDVYTPKNLGDYFGEGVYVPRVTEQVDDFVSFVPSNVLQSRYAASIPRSSQSPRDYSIGKICFGLYSTDLIARIRVKHGRLFFPISPDYTSMVLALGTAQSGVVARESGVVHVNTDLSNGRLVASSDLAAFDFLKLTDPTLNILNDLPIPHLYCSTNNLILNDYRQMMKKLGIAFPSSLGNWAEYISTDITSDLRTWSSSSVYAEQRELLLHALVNEGSKTTKAGSPVKRLLNSVFIMMQSKSPMFVKKFYRRIKFGRLQRTCRDIFEILTY